MKSYQISFFRRHLAKCLLFLLYALVLAGAGTANARVAVDLQFTDAERQWLTENHELTVAYDDANAPLNYRRPDGSAAGISIDYVNIIAEKTGLSISFEGSSWSEALEKAMNHEVDVIVSASKKKERLKSLSFTRPYCETPLAIAVNNSYPPLSHLSDLSQRRVAVVKATVRIALLRQLSPHAEITEVSSPEEGMKLITEGKADAFFDDLPVIEHLIRDRLFSNIRIGLLYYSDFGAQRLGVRNNTPELHSILDKAIGAISEHEHRLIWRKWFALSENTPAQRELNLTDEEKQWLASNPYIRVGSDSNYAPIEFQETDGSMQGISVEYLKKISTLLNVQFEVVKGHNWSELINMAKNREIDMFTAMVETPKRSEFLNFTIPYTSFPISVFTQQNTPYVNNIKNLSGYDIAIAKGYAVEEFIGNDYPDISIDAVQSVSSGIDQLVRGEVYGVISNQLVASYYLAQKGITTIKVGGETPYTSRLSIAVRKDWPIFISILNKALAAIPEEEKNSYYRKWLSFTYEHKLDKTTFLEFALLGLIIIIVILFWNLRLAKQVVTQADEFELQKRQLQAALDASPVGIIIAKAPEGAISYANSAALKVRGDTEKRLTHIKIDEYSANWNVTHANGTPYASDKLPLSRSISHGETIENHECIIIRDDGSKRWILVNSAPVFDDKKEIAAGVVVFSDITERKLIESQLLQVKQQQALVLSSLPMIFYTRTEDDPIKIQWLSDTINALTGYDAEKFIEDPLFFRERLHPADADRVENGFRTLKSKMQISLEYRWKTRSGKYHWFHEEAVLVSSADNKNPLVVGSILDIHKRKEQELNLLLTQQSVDRSSLPLIWFNDKKEYIYTNDAASSLFGYSKEEFKDASPGILHPQGSTDYWDLLPLLQEHGSIQRKLSFRKKDGTIIPCLLDATYLNFEESGYIFASIIDLTERQEMEERLQHAQKMEAIGTLAGGIAHDFNNILSAIYGYTQLAQLAKDSPEKQEKSLNGIYEAANRAKDLIKQILTFSRLSKQEKRELELSQLGKEVVKLIRQMVPKTIDIHLDISSSRKIVADPTQIHQVLMNLCTNAYHAMRHKGGVLSISIKDYDTAETQIRDSIVIPAGEYVHIEVSDTGVGMKEEVLEKIFEPYFTTKEISEGTGLGLSVVHGIVRDHNGYITCSSIPDEGTTFEVFLPIKATPAAESLEEVNRSIGLHGNERIIFVDDEWPLLDIVANVCPKYGYSVSVFDDPEEALAQFKTDSEQFDILITDMTMPKMTGTELIQSVRKYNPKIPTVLCTGYSDMTPGEDVLQEDGIHYLEKPFPMKKLLRNIRLLLNKKEA